MMHIILGLGKTGLSCARYLAKQSIDFIVCDSRKAPPELATLQQQLPHITVKCGEFSTQLLCAAKCIIASPGVDLQQPAIIAAKKKSIPIIGDIELFVRRIEQPIVAITGSNGKSTVTQLITDMAFAAGINVAMAGNIGIPVLDLLTQPPAELYILELSSFQLETTYSLNAEVATLLNISPDHLDRYENLMAYAQAKQRIYHQAKYCIFNNDDNLTIPTVHDNSISFSLQAPHNHQQFGLRNNYLVQGE
ncbi:MAG: UDP-N-acetylmuramoyl-L-alanine--D-glutamate ligase, partial [Gammaproteobacteria bacterium]|nr:UDP-N-acetylmuramoyl-L-alanine--D-glutamate ligase [Gammaproteobacteria bacterium]